MSEVTLYGPEWSAYARTVRLTLIEKQIAYELLEVDFSSGEMPEDQLLRHPFSKVPALRHNNFMIYETAAICRYVDAAFEGPSLQPSRARLLGRMAQIIGILDAYISEEIRMGFVSELLINPMLGLSVDLGRVELARSSITRGFNALGDCISAGEFLAGDQLTLADLHAAPLFDYLSRTPGGDELINSQAELSAWWSKMQNRESIAATQPDLSVFRV